jgi:GntR family transcriptional regulator
MPLRLTVNPRGGYPVYLQIVQQVQRAIAVGLLKPGEQLPTVKQLAADLVINASTVAKALRELEHLQVISTLPGRGSYVCEHGQTLALEQSAEGAVTQALESAVREAREVGIEGSALRALFDRIYDAVYAPSGGEPIR